MRLMATEMNEVDSLMKFTSGDLIATKAKCHFIMLYEILQPVSFSQSKWPIFF